MLDLAQVQNFATEPLNAVRGSHAIYTDTWVSMGCEGDRVQRVEAFRCYSFTQESMELDGSSSVFMHCLPAYWGCEVQPEVIDGPQSIDYDQVESRRSAQMAVMYHQEPHR